MALTQQDCSYAQQIYDNCISAGGTASACDANAAAAYPGYPQDCQQSSVGQYFGNPANWIDFASGLTGIVGDIIGYTQDGQPIYSSKRPPVDQTNDYTMYWVIGGFAVIILLLVIFLALK